jgi:hypothetical protein
MTPQNLFLTTVFIALAGVGVLETRVVFRQRDEHQTLQKRLAAESRQTAMLRDECETAQQNLNGAEQELAGLTAPSVEDAATAARQTEIKAWLARLKQLQRLVAERPEHRIPEVQLLTDEDWLRVAQRASFGDEHDMRKAFGELRSACSSRG